MKEKFSSLMVAVRKNPAAFLFLFVLVLTIPIGIFLAMEPVLFQPKAAVTSAVLSVQPASQTMAVGETGSVSVVVNPGENEVMGVQLIMNYDPAIMQVTGLQPGSFFTEPNVGAPYELVKDFSTPGYINYTLGFPLGSFYGSSVVADVARITFMAVAEGQSNFTFNTTQGSLVTKVSDIDSINVLGSTQIGSVLVGGGARLFFSGPAPANPQQAGGSFTSEVMFDTGGYAVDAVDARITFDPAYLSVASIAEDVSGNGFSSYPEITYDNSTGSIVISGNLGSGTSPTPLNGSQIRLASINFTSIAETIGTELRFLFTPGARNDSNIVKHVEFSGSDSEDVLASVVSQSIVVEPSPTPTPTPTPVPDPVCADTTATAAGQGSCNQYVSCDYYGDGSVDNQLCMDPYLSTDPVQFCRDLCNGITPPSPTPTPTPTPTPIPQAMTFKVRLQGRNWAGAQQVSSATVGYIRTDIAESQAPTLVALSSLGEFQLTLDPGNFVFNIEASGYLNRNFGTASNPVVVTQGESFIDLSLQPVLGGDFNNDDIVNEIDYTLHFLNKFLSADEVVDIDGSGEVNNLDYAVMRSNWGLSSEQL